MNLFLIERHPDLIAKALDDKRLFAQAKEGVQMLSTAILAIGRPIYKSNGELMKPAHQNHPLTKWVAQSGQAFRLMYDVSVNCLIEHHHRFGTHYKLITQLKQLKHYRYAFPSRDNFSYCLCLPGQYLELAGGKYCSDLDQVVKLYRAYCYYSKRMQFDSYTKRLMPQWLLNVDKIKDVECSELAPF